MKTIFTGRAPSGPPVKTVFTGGARCPPPVKMPRLYKCQAVRTKISLSPGAHSSSPMPSGCQKFPRPPTTSAAPPSAVHRPELRRRTVHRAIRRPPHPAFRRPERRLRTVPRPCAIRPAELPATVATDQGEPLHCPLLLHCSISSPPH